MFQPMKEWEAGVNPTARVTEKDTYYCNSNYYVVRPKGEFPHGLWIADCGRAGDDEAKQICKLIAKTPTMLNKLVDLHNIIENWHCCNNELFDRQSGEVLEDLTKTLQEILCPYSLKS